MRNKWAKDLAQKLAGSVGTHLAKRTKYAELNSLIHWLHPVDSGVELIRLGPDGDGGYLVPNDLAGIEYCFSPGVSTESGFEAALAARGMRVFLADYSVDRPAQANANFQFDKKYIGCLSDKTFMTLDEWKEKYLRDYRNDLILQMDIEGFEFETLLSTSAALLAQFRIMVIEFHYLQDLWNKPYFNLASRMFEKLLRTHSVVHIHPNNCCGAVASAGLVLPRVAEFTFYRNDRLRHREYCRTFPHPLDRDNTSNPTLNLPRCWYR